MLQLKVRRTRNALGVTLPAEAARALNVKDSDSIYLTTSPDGSMRITACDPDFGEAIHAPESYMARYRHAFRALAK